MAITVGNVPMSIFGQSSNDQPAKIKKKESTSLLKQRQKIRHELFIYGSLA